MTTNTNAALSEAERLLRRDAESLREGYTSHRDRDDWAGEDDAKAGYDEYIRAADALAALTTAAAQPCDSITDAEIDAIAEGMPGGIDGFLKGWGWRQFARAVLEYAALPEQAAAAPKAEPVQTDHFPDAGEMVPGTHIQQPYSLAEIKAKIASNDYSAELMLQHAMLLLEKPDAVAGPVIGYRISDPNEPDLGHWFSEEPGEAWCKSEPLGIVATPTTQASPQPAVQQGDAEDAARWRAHVGKLDALVAYCPTCCQGVTAGADMTRDEVIFQCGRAQRSAEVKRLREALDTAIGHIDMDALRVSHCKDAALIDAARSQAKEGA